MALSLCVLVWPNDASAAELVAHEDQVLPLVDEHGGRVLQRVRNRAQDPTGAQPCEVHVIDFPSETALDTLFADERRTALAPLRNRPIARTHVFHVDVV